MSEHGQHKYIHGSGRDYIANKYGRIAVMQNGTRSPESTKEAAQRIVHCVNHFDEVVEALEEIAAVKCAGSGVNAALLITCRDKARAVLERVKK